MNSNLKLILDIEAKLKELKSALQEPLPNYAPTMPTGPSSPFTTVVNDKGIQAVLEILMDVAPPNTQAFIESLMAGLDRYKRLTDKQMAVVEKIWLDQQKGLPPF